MPVPSAVHDLIERFRRNQESYFSVGYNEEHTRIEFINPLFEALGWDVSNKRGYSEDLKDLIHEDSIKIAGYMKAPDYCFRAGGTRKFFLEAKKPSVNLKTDPEPAFQLRRYAWSAKLPLSILTNFAEFVVYDCRIRPAQSDRASKARVLYLTIDEYVDRWDEISEIFSKESLFQGEFDRFAAETRLKRGTTEVDDAFLQDIESWRSSLARNIAIRNRRIDVTQLNFVVQRTIDRLIFLRICEDRGIETEARLLGATNGRAIYKRLCEGVFREADDRYNSGLFHFRREKGRAEPPDDLSLTIKIDDEPLRALIRGLYYPQSPYVFSKIPPEILGQVYEQFLGKVIRLTKSHQAKVEDKPEVRRAGGVYYTPTHIVDHIVRATISPLLSAKTPAQVSTLRVLDPACGSGSFLLSVYQHLLDWHLGWYLAHDPEKHAKVIYERAPGAWSLTANERKRILTNNIFGVDIDPQAVEVTKLSLLLKVLEGETHEKLNKQLKLLHERALPDLGRNIRRGNSLVESDILRTPGLFDDGRAEATHPFDWSVEFKDIWKHKGFDAVLGNPPYDVVEKERGGASWPHDLLADYVRERADLAPALGGKLNLFRLFVVRAVSLTRSGGRWGMIVPLALLADISCARTRAWLLSNTKDLEADCFPQKDDARRRVFRDAKLSTAVLAGIRCKERALGRASILVRTYPANSVQDEAKQALIEVKDLATLDPENLPIPLLDESEWALCKKIHSSPGVVRLGDVADFQIRRGEVNQSIYRSFITSNPKQARLLKGVEVGRFHTREKLSQGSREWFDEYSFASEHSPWDQVKARRIATQRITGLDEVRRVVAAIVEPPCYFADSTNSIGAGPSATHSLEYLVALLNSRLIQWRFQLTSTNNNVGTNELKALPFRTIGSDDEPTKAIAAQLVALVSAATFAWSKRLRAKSDVETSAASQNILAIERQIDHLTCQLFQLTDDEVLILECMATKAKAEKGRVRSDSMAEAEDKAS